MKIGPTNEVGVICVDRRKGARGAPEIGVLGSFSQIPSKNYDNGLDGITFSNSYAYVKKGLNWTGVLVEASPRNYQQQLEMNHPNKIANVHAGIC